MSDPPRAAESHVSPLSASARHRLQKVYEHAKRCFEKQDYDYAHQLFTQCVAEDPANLTYLQALLENLQRKYGDNRKGSKLAGLKIKSHRSALNKAAGRGHWEQAFAAGCAALALNPWDIATLIGLAEACRELSIDECQLYYLKWALNVEPKNPDVNRLAAEQLTRMGQFDQAIACWQRVRQAKPDDEAAAQAISRLSVEKTIHQGGYDPALLSDADKPAGHMGRVADDETAADDQPQVPLTERLEQQIAVNPTELGPYFQLADAHMHEGRIDEAEAVLGRANAAAGGGDLEVRERLEDLQLRRAHRQVEAAERRHAAEPTNETRDAVANLRRQANQVELEVFGARSDRNPQNERLKFEMGVRLKKAGKYKEAIKALQAARSDSKHKVQVLVELGECFQRIEQYKLALSNYEQAVEASADSDSDVRKLALYRSGVLATGLRQFDVAERRLTELAGLDYGYRDVADRLDNLGQLSDSR